MATVLVVEDDFLMADMIKDILNEHGYHVCGTAATVADAVLLGKQFQPDLAVIDLRLADGGLGTEVAAQLKDSANLGILYATGNAARVMFDGAHGHACLTKPYRDVDLLRGLEIVSEIVATGTASRPFPRNFHLLNSVGSFTRKNDNG